MLIDALLPCVVVAQTNDPSAITTVAGQAWIIGSTPVGAWAGHALKIAVFWDGSLRFASPVPGMRLLDRAVNVLARYDGKASVALSAISDP